MVLVWGLDHGGRSHLHIDLLAPYLYIASTASKASS